MKGMKMFCRSKALSAWHAAIQTLDSLCLKVFKEWAKRDDSYYRLRAASQRKMFVWNRSETCLLQTDCKAAPRQ